MATENPIRIDPEIVSGTPCFAGTRVPVKCLFDALDYDRSIAYFLEEFPSVTREQVDAALAVAFEALVASAERVRARTGGMKLLLDENLPHSLRHRLLPHGAFTVKYMGWSSTKNGALLRLAADAGFDALLTTDRGFAHQHNPATLPLSVVICSVPANDIDAVLPLVPALLARLDTLRPRSVAWVP